jgi:segregation and condensation protein B
MELEALVESLLFVADRPVTTESLAAALEVETEQVTAALERLDATYQGRGVRLQRNKGLIQLVSAPEAAAQIERFLGLEHPGRLSSAALEALSIVAYLQPVTRAHVEAIRGVHSDSVLRSLVRRGLIEEVGRAETAGRPILFGTTFAFLEQFGLQSLDELPRWQEFKEELDQLTAQEELGEASP